MKQTLLLVFCCLIVFAVTNAQKVRIADTTYSSEDNGAMLHLYDTRQLRYNEDCNNDAIYYLDYDFDSGSVDQKEYDTIEYDKNKLAYRYTYQYWNSVTNVYENSSRTTYTRDNSKNITSQLNEVWQNNSWHTQYFDSGEYNANNDKTYDLFETWDVYADTLLGFQTC